MANNNKHTGPNVPALRFPEFTKEWEMASLQDIAAVNPKSNPLQNSFVYIDLEAVEKGELRKIQEVMREEAPSRAQRVIYKNDILFQCVRPYQKNNYIHKIQSKSNQQWVASTGYAQIRTTEIPNYIYHLLNTDGFNRKVMVRCTGSSYPAINSEDLATIRFYLTTDTKEQLKISRLLDLLDERIATQNKIIEELKTLRSALRHKLLHEMLIERTAKLGTLCRIATGKLDANAMVEGGNYPFFTCAEQVYEIDRYAFDTEALLISGNGANLGYIHYYYGKFNAYQRTYVLSDFSEDIQYLRQYLEANLSKRIESEKNTGNTPYIVLGTLADMEIELPSKPVQKTIANELGMLSLKLEYETHYLSLLMKEKVALLNRMFI